MPRREAASRTNKCRSPWPTRAARCLLAASLGLMLWFNLSSLVEAYGNGPPHYWPRSGPGRWAYPMPALAIIDAAALLWCIAVCRWIARQHAR